MDLPATLTGFPHAAPLSGLDRAWQWSLNPVLRYAGVLTGDGTRLLQMNTRGSYSEDLTHAVLTFAREHERELLQEGRPLVSAEGFSAPGHAFDTVAVAAPDVAQLHQVRNPELTPLTYALFPAYACEFSGRETLPEAAARYVRMLRAAEIGRAPVPFLKMRYDNPRTGGGSTNQGRVLTYPSVLLDELPQLENSPGAFVEYENRAGLVWRVEWAGGFWAIAGESGRWRRLGLDELRLFVEESLV